MNVAWLQEHWLWVLIAAVCLIVLYWAFRRKLLWIFIAAVTLVSLVLVTNTFIAPMPAYLLRASGVVNLISIAFIAFLIRR